MAKKCTKKRDARVKLFYLLNLLVFCGCRCRRRPRCLSPVLSYARPQGFFLRVKNTESTKRSKGRQRPTLDDRSSEVCVL